MEVGRGVRKVVNVCNRFKLDEISPGACLPRYKARLFDYELLSKPCT